MGNPKAFLTIPRKEAGYRPISDRLHDFSEVEQTLNSKDRMEQASRCMDCGVPFCHWACPLGNKCPEWNDALYHGNWELAYRLLTSTNPFPEFTGRVCPALCEKSCVLYLTDHAPTTNRENEAAIMERAWLESYIQPEPPAHRIGRRVAIIGAGPAGLSAAWYLNKAGVDVTVFDKAEAAGGLLRYGIPNFKLNKKVIDRRIALMEAEGIHFVYKADIDVASLAAGADKPLPDSLQGFDAYVVATGTPQARDLDIPGRDLHGIYLALDMLSQQNRILAGMQFPKEELVNAKGKRVLVIGGGDTGSDCIGTAHRQGCKGVVQIEIMPQPPEGDNPSTPWPAWPVVMKTTTSHEEGCERRWLLNSTQFLGKNGKVVGVEVEEVSWQPDEATGRMKMIPSGKKEVIDCDMVLLALGFLRPQQPQFGPNVYVAGDAAAGASLVVRAIESGRAVARKIIGSFNK
ncbi:MAG: glutamate synthase subunit beta [Bacteroidales bacterium]|nr:glutamate synthase subunit beta [Bacteroidales bacterium]